MNKTKIYLQLSAVCLALSVALIVLSAYDAHRYMEFFEGKPTEVPINQVLFEGFSAVICIFFFAFFMIVHFITTNKAKKE